MQSSDSSVNRIRCRIELRTEYSQIKYRGDNDVIGSSFMITCKN